MFLIVNDFISIEYLVNISIHFDESQSYTYDNFFFFWHNLNGLKLILSIL